MIGEHTRAALAAKGAEGAAPGNRTNLAEAQTQGVALNRAAADAFRGKRASNRSADAGRKGENPAGDRHRSQCPGHLHGTRRAWHDSAARNLLARGR
jgi:hypothetical protein